MNVHIKSLGYWACLEDMIGETWHLSSQWRQFCESCTQSQSRNLVKNFLGELQASEMLVNWLGKFAIIPEKFATNLKTQIEKIPNQKGTS